jgi:hypothetical protein
VEGATPGFTDPDGRTIFLSVNNEIALLITTATGKWIFEGHYASPSSGKPPCF